MNCPSRNDDPEDHDGYNQNPPYLPSELTTQADLNNIMNLKGRTDVNQSGLDTFRDRDQIFRIGDGPSKSAGGGVGGESRGAEDRPLTVVKTAEDTTETASVMTKRIASNHQQPKGVNVTNVLSNTTISSASSNGSGGFRQKISGASTYVVRVMGKYSRFIGPGFMISVSYMDPGNYSTDVAAGAQFRFAHLFVVLLSNVFAIFLQALCVKLGTVTGMDLAQNCKFHLPKWLNYILYFLAECAIIATDIAEVIGSAIALNILLKIPLVAGVAITCVDVFVVLFFYRADGPVRNLRYFEMFVAMLVFGVIICFCIELANIHNVTAGEVIKGYLPSKTIASGEGLYLSCGILGATVMPHSLYLGSGLVQARVKEFDIKEGTYVPENNLSETGSTKEYYHPSISAIRSTMKYTVADLAISLLTCALFANSAILIVSGATLDSSAGDADLFSIHDLLSRNLSAAAGTIFALALLFSGESAGIVVTLAGQMISEGFLDWRLKPWIRRSITRGIAILPALVVAATVGRSGLSTVLNASQVALSILLPFVSAPLVYMTCRSHYMRVVDRSPLQGSSTSLASDGEGGGVHVDGTNLEAVVPEAVDMSNGWVMTICSVIVWGFIAALNMYLIITLASGKD